MLNRYNKGVLFITCRGCSKDYIHQLKPGQTIRFLEDIGEYENLKTNPCPECGMVEVFNMNIEKEEFNYSDIEEIGIPNKEVNQRKYIRDIMKERCGALPGKR